MTHSARLSTAALTLLLAGTARAEVVTEMTPDLVREAIACGHDAAAKRRSGEPVSIPGVGAFGFFNEALTISTPFMRVSLAAAEAEGKRLPFSETQVTPEMTEPRLDVLQNGFILGRSAVNYTHIVLARGSGEAAEVIQPTKVEATTQEWANSYGAKTVTHGVKASFPLSVLVVGNEFRLIRDDGRETAEPITATHLAQIR